MLSLLLEFAINPLTLLSVFITAGRTPGFQFTFDAMEFYRHNKSLIGLNTLAISFKEAVTFLAGLKEGFESGKLNAPAPLEESDLADTKSVIKAFEKVKAGAKGKQILVNRNLGEA